MTSRERFIAAINHKQPDKVPIDFGATQTSGINVCALYRLREYYGLPQKPLEIFEMIQMLGTVDEDIRRLMGSDVIGLNSRNNALGLPFVGPKKTFIMNDRTPALISADHAYDKLDNGRIVMYPLGDRALEPSMMMPEGGYFFDIINRSPGFDEDNLTPAEDFKDFFSIISDEDARFYESESKRLFEETEYGIIGIFGLGGLGDAAFVPGSAERHPKGIRKFEDWCMALLLYPEYIKEVFEMQTANVLNNLEIYKQAVGDRIHAIVMSGTDFGTQHAPFMNLETFRELYKPYYTRMNDWVHKNTNWKTYYHSCGAISTFLDDFVEMGVDIINPVQLSATGMDAKMLKSKYGDKLTFWGGGIDTQHMLPNGTPEEIKAQVKERLNILAPGGGYIFNTIHNIQGNIKVENIVATFDAAKEYRY